ncbi:GTPase-activator protein for ras-like GTPase domain-containing protein [Sarocladium implicatum]|nr:GTPase-activator protein for ras-like GTPase domain-containing protein [Sarocladium implicatum]
MDDDHIPRRQNGAHAHDREWSADSPPLEVEPDLAVERPSATNLRAAYRSPGIRAVTPDPDDAIANASHMRSLNSDASPRSIPGGSSRRQGMVFNDSYVDPYDSADDSPPTLPQRPSQPGSTSTTSSLRPRTRTLDMSMLAQRSAPPGLENRHRVSSVSSSGSQALTEDHKPSPGSLDTMDFPNIATSRIPEFATPQLPPREKKSSGRRLMKRQSSRPTSPLVAAPPTIDSIPFPVLASDAQKIILLMKTLCGKMRGEVEYQGENGGPWYAGIAYIDVDKGCLMFDSGQAGPFHIPLVSDLRGCRVLPVDYPDAGRQCIELVSSQPPVEVVLTPMLSEDFDFWLAALLPWQQLRPSNPKSPGGKPSSPVVPVRPDLKRRGSSNGGRNPNIIKVGNIMLWDKGHASSPRALVHRSSTRDARSPGASWRRVSCILQDNGEFRLLLENEQIVLSVIELSQLSRSAIQQLDRTVLDEEYCIAIFPTYASSAIQLSIFRPVYLALESRTQFEVWFVLLRAFAVPDNVHRDDPDNERIELVTELTESTKGPVFRLERTVSLRVTEAKLKAKPAGFEAPPPEKGSKVDFDPLVGNYIAEVVLDGEVRARTTIKTDTKNPFWREDVEFLDLHHALPELSVLLKRIDGSPDSVHLYMTGNSSNSKTPQPVESIFGFVKLQLASLEAGKDHEQWEPITDDHEQVLGSMLLKVTHDEHLILMAKEYEPLAEVLHRFPSGLTTLIAGALPGQLRRLADLFLNIFQVSGSAGEWLMALVEDEIDGIGNQATIKKYRFSSRLGSNESADSNSADRQVIVRDMGKSLAGEANLLFRGNSLLTQSLEFHMRRLGKEYIENILGPKIAEINEINPDCEVDPSKLHHSGSELDQHWNQLILHTTEIWQAIAKTATKIPPELRHIFKYIRAVAEDRYGDFLRTVTYTSVSGFLFLRFICPAILSPKLWGLLRDHPRPRAQRTFTLITKALQKLANVSTFGKREEWMEPMNRFLNAQRQSFRDFIDKVCDIPAERGTAMLPAGYSTPMTIVNRLGPVAREGFPSLPYLIDSTRSYAGLIKLWVDSKPQQNSKTPIDGELLVFSELCISLQERVDCCLAKLDTIRAAQAEDPEPMSSDLAEAFEAALLIEASSATTPIPTSNGSSTGLADNQHHPGITFADNVRPPGSSGSDYGGEASGSGGSGSGHSRKSKDARRPNAAGPGGAKIGSSTLRQVSGAGTTRVKNGGNKVGRTILSGIMRIGGGGSGSGTAGATARSVSPDSKGQK